MPGLLQLSFDPDARVRGDAFLKRVSHGDMSVAVEHRDEVGLLVNLTGAHHVRGLVDGRFRSDTPRPGSVSVLPPSCQCRLEISGCCSVLMLRVSWRHIAAAASRVGLDAHRIALVPRLNEDDAELARLLFQAAAGGSGDAFRPAVERIAERLIAPPVPAARRRSVGLTGTTLRRVMERCRDPARSRPSLDDLAHEAGLSRYHFARSFKVATGYSPNAFLLKCRADDALDLLARTDWPVGEIAREAGFAHPSHLARHVRRATGFPPEAYRRHVLP